MNSDGLSLASGEKSNLSFAGKNGGWSWICEESLSGGLVGLVGFLTAGVATRIISATCSPVSGLLWTICRFFALLGGLGRSVCCVSSSISEISLEHTGTLQLLQALESILGMFLS